MSRIYLKRVGNRYARMAACKQCGLWVRLKGPQNGNVLCLECRHPKQKAFR